MNMTTQVAGSGQAPQQVLESIVHGINTGDLDALMRLYEPGAAFAAQPGTSRTACLASGPRSQPSSPCAARSTSP